MPAYWLAAAVLVALAAIAVLRTRLLLVKVHGSSMAPGYEDGDLLLARRVSPSHAWRAGEDLVFARTGDVVVPPGDPACLVKRVCAVPGDAVPERPGEMVSSDWLILRGTNGSGARAPFYYSVPVSAVLGKVITTLRRSRSQPSSAW